MQESKDVVKLGTNKDLGGADGEDEGAAPQAELGDEEGGVVRGGADEERRLQHVAFEQRQPQAEPFEPHQPRRVVNLPR